MDPRIEFLLEMWSTPTSRRAQKTIPFVREILAAGQAGAAVGRSAYELERKLGGSSDVSWYSPEIQRYTESALGSTRII